MISTSSVIGAAAETDRERNARALRHAVAQQNLEGLQVSSAAIEDMQRAATGEISEMDVIRNIRSRYSECLATQTVTRTPIPHRES